MLLRDIWDLFNLSQFDPINQMIPLTLISLSRARCNTRLEPVDIAIFFNLTFMNKIVNKLDFFNIT